MAEAACRLEEALIKSRTSDDPQYVQYASIDPNNQYWSDFRNKLLSLWPKDLGKPPPKLENDRKHMKEKLQVALESHNDERLDKAVYFSFLDYVFARQRSDGSSKLQKFADLRYPSEWYSTSRQVQRQIHLHIGPTNSGKTYNALKRLEEAGDGYYAGPLRLLAHEVYSRFRAKGIPCNLVTGDDIRKDPDQPAKISSSTVEMVDVVSPVDVAVIDEIQMIAQKQRGWAWTRAFLGANAKEVHLCGEARVVPLIRELAGSIGDTLHIHEYERLNPLKAMSKSLGGNLKKLRKGDCVVCFSILRIHAMKKQIETETGRRVAIVYGSLPPETRAQQAALFNAPDNDYDFLVGSDAIGMGLNL